MTLTDIPNYKQRVIMKWLNEEISSAKLELEILCEYNPKAYEIITAIDYHAQRDEQDRV